jgi:hypothetical protein
MRGAALAGQVAEAVGWLEGLGGLGQQKGKYITEKRCRYSKSRQPKNCRSKKHEWLWQANRKSAVKNSKSRRKGLNQSGFLNAGAANGILHTTMDSEP